MPEKAILAIEEALLANLFTQRALIELLIEKKIIKKEDLEKQLMQSDISTVGVGKEDDYLYLEKRSGKQRRQKRLKVNINKRSGKERRKT